MCEDIVEFKEAKNLFSALATNQNSIFYGADEITKPLTGNKKR